LKKDYARYGLIHDLEDGQDPDTDQEGKPLTGAEDSGWKQVHGDVFRAPALLPLFSALLGTGWQLVTLTLGVIVFAVMGPLHGEVHEERGEVLHAILVCYSLSSIVSGYTSGQFFKQYYPTTARKNPASTSLWQATMGLTVLLLPTVAVIVLSFLNAVSLVYGTINTIPFLVIVKLFLLWIFVSVPLCVVGTLFGRHAKLGGAPGKGGDHFPCRVNAIPRPIPEEVPWYGKPSGLIPLAGLLSFGSIFIELYYVLTSLWNYKFYHVYGFLLGVYCILTIVVSMTSIIVVYFCLNAENYLWQWTAFFSGGSTALYVYVYGIYYFLFKTQMNGFLQTSFYFGYMFLISLTLGILCGTLGHSAASNFVRAIFQNVKVD
jgi:transmembrane 9 superfamily protein 3